MGAQQPHEPAVAQSVDVNFGGMRLEGDRPVPKCREGRAFAAVAQPIGALAAHARGGRRLGDTASAGESVEEAKLALGCPAVAADLGAGLGRTKRSRRAHSPAWI